MFSTPARAAKSCLRRQAGWPSRSTADSGVIVLPKLFQKVFHANGEILGKLCLAHIAHYPQPTAGLIRIAAGDRKALLKQAVRCRQLQSALDRESKNPLAAECSENGRIVIPVASAMARITIFHRALLVSIATARIW